MNSLESVLAPRQYAFYRVAEDGRCGEGTCFSSAITGGELRTAMFSEMKVISHMGSRLNQMRSRCYQIADYDLDDLVGLFEDFKPRIVIFDLNGHRSGVFEASCATVGEFRRLLLQRQVTDKSRIFFGEMKFPNGDVQFA